MNTPSNEPLAPTQKPLDLQELLKTSSNIVDALRKDPVWFRKMVQEKMDSNRGDAQKMAQELNNMGRQMEQALQAQGIIWEKRNKVYQEALGDPQQRDFMAAFKFILEVVQNSQDIAESRTETVSSTLGKRFTLESKIATDPKTGDIKENLTIRGIYWQELYTPDGKPFPVIIFPTGMGETFITKAELTKDLTQIKGMLDRKELVVWDPKARLRPKGQSVE